MLLPNPIAAIPFLQQVSLTDWFSPCDECVIGTGEDHDDEEDSNGCWYDQLL